jgi:DNA-binding NarL/FixJ family response regulator
MPCQPYAPPAAALAALTSRETQTMRLMAEVLSNLEIADRLTVTEETVKTHVSRILTNLGCLTVPRPVVTDYETGLVTPRRQQ